MTDQTFPPPVQPSSFYLAQQSGPAGCCSSPNGAAAGAVPPVTADDLLKAEAVLGRLWDALAAQLAGLEEFAGPGLAAPLQRPLAELRAEVWLYVSVAMAAAVDLGDERLYHRLWRGTTQAMVAVARDERTEDAGDPSLASEIAAVQALRDQRDQARAIAAGEFKDNARLSNAAVELAGARAYAAVLEERLASWVAAGKIGKEAARTARRAAEANAEAATGQAMADALAHRAQMAAAGEMEADLFAALQRAGS